jgi:hypothetical protein
MKNLDVALNYGCLLVQNQRYAEAVVILNSLLKSGYEVCKVNLVLSIVYQKLQDNQLALKYKSIAFVEFMR